MTEEPLALAETPAPDNPSIPAAPPPPFWATRRARIAGIVILVLAAACFFVFGFYYVKFARLIDRRLAAGAFSDTVNIFGTPRAVAVGDELTAPELIARLKQSGYSTARGNTLGWYNLTKSAVEIFPGRDSHTGSEPGVLHFDGNKISRIVSLQDNTERSQFTLEPQLIANLSKDRERRRLVHFREIPQTLVHAVISVEDKHFFRHSGIDFSRLLKAAYIDLREGRKEQGASTLTMQLARGLWLDAGKTWSRKLQEVLIAIHLEHELTKQQIFEYYANEVYLGRRGTFNITGFGEASHAFFAKDLQQLTLPEAALLAGMVQRPSYYNPMRYPDRARERRNVVLTLMRQNGYISESERRAASQVPVKVTPEPLDGVDSQYFIDLMTDELQDRLPETETRTRYIYTTLDPDLQQAAQDAVRTGMAAVDARLKKRKRKVPAGQPQVALVALDPHTGEIRALVGGRSYSASQLNHATAMRQPGSVFKPIVYAAALNTAIEGGRQVFTPATVMDDSPTTFYYQKQSYTPSNFHQEFMGPVTLRTALAHSLNVVAVQVAQSVGLDRVVAMARRLGLNDGIKATPAVALGAYEATPIEMAGAYTVFANQGKHLTPSTISLVRGPDGTVLYQHHSDPRPALDPRVNYLIVSMMQDVMRRGTGASVYSLGFNQPAAGKTGTSRDGWFAGFTSNLLCIVWVGFDDNSDLNLEGAHSALPIWAEFMKRASKMRNYRNAKQFPAPAGIVSRKICADSGMLAGDYCPNVRTDIFISGTEPAVECQLHSFQPLPLERVWNPAAISPDRPARPMDKN